VNVGNGRQNPFRKLAGEVGSHRNSEVRDVQADPGPDSYEGVGGGLQHVKLESEGVGVEFDAHFGSAGSGVLGLGGRNARRKDLRCAFDQPAIG